jgi:putative tryptophan/tyrosine transport system substrate-binding protein
MRRRDFLSVLGGATVAWPFSARGQQPMPVIGFLNSGSADAYPDRIVAFREGLGQIGYIEGQNATIDFRWAFGQYERLAGLATELVRRPATILVATGGEPAALAAKNATSSIPIVFAIGGDPVKLGLVVSYNQPGGNATGTTLLTTALEAKRLGLLHELVPHVATIGALLNPNYPVFEDQLTDLREAAQTIGLRVHVLRANTDEEIEAAFETVNQQSIAALAVASAPFFDTRRNKLVSLAARHAVPTVYQFREFATAGGLMSYGVSIPHVYRQVGVYTGRILKGAKPADLPVVQPTKFELVINLKTAKVLGLTVPPQFLASADEVIE